LAQRRQVRIREPVLQALPGLGPCLRRSLLDQPGVGGQVGTQPGQRLRAQTVALLVGDRAGVLAPPGRGEGRGAGSVVAVTGARAWTCCRACRAPAQRPWLRSTRPGLQCAAAYLGSRAMGFW